MATSKVMPEAEFLCTLGKDALFFRRMQGSEELGRLSEYRVELLRSQKDARVDPEKLLGTSATVKILLPKGEWRYINGWVTAVELGGAIGRFDIVRLELRPWLWYLTLGSDCRIFQDMTAMEIIEKVFKDYKSAAFDKKITGSLHKRPYCVQYRESDFDFVSRLMEEEGIYYYFKHIEDDHKLVLCNDSSGHTVMKPAKLGWALKRTDDQLRDDIVTQWRLVQQMRSMKFVHTDYDPEKPTTDLLSQASRAALKYSTPGDLEVFDHAQDFADPGGAQNKKEGERRAKLRATQFEAGHKLGTMATPCRGVAAGRTFTLTDHPNAGDFLITQVTFEMERGDHEANDEAAETGFTARAQIIPKATSFASQPITPRPFVRGPQTAEVVGKSGDEIHTDKFGRVKVHFHWDRVGKKDEKASCFVRVSTPWASKGYGMVSLPRVGDEVVVSFLEGNPDKPLITGRVYNADSMPPYELPAQATVSGIKSRSSKKGAAANANELRFDDMKGEEYVWFQAEKDFHQLVKNDAYRTVKKDEWVGVEKNSAHKIGESMTLDVGKVTTVSVGEDTHVKLGADLNLGITGAMNVDAGEAVAFKGGAAIEVTSGSGMDISVGQGMNIKATSSVHIKGLGVVIDGGTELCIKAGGAFITLGPAGVVIQGTLVKINSGGAAGSANSAKAAKPAKPKKPAKLKDNKDKLAK
jgi:type VI secretion system secreted protein VgrG